MENNYYVKFSAINLSFWSGCREKENLERTSVSDFTAWRRELAYALADLTNFSFHRSDSVDKTSDMTWYQIHWNINMYPKAERSSVITSLRKSRRAGHPSYVCVWKSPQTNRWLCWQFSSNRNMFNSSPKMWWKDGMHHTKCRQVQTCEHFIKIANIKFGYLVVHKS